MNLTPQEYADKLIEQYYYSIEGCSYQIAKFCALIDVQNTIDAMAELGLLSASSAVGYYHDVKSILEGYLNGGA